MDVLYKRIIKQIINSGRRIHKKSVDIQNIKMIKEDSTDEDIRIERELKRIVKEFDPKQCFYAEEENTHFFDAEDTWIVDPISGTKAFIEGMPHYGIVAAHLYKQEVQFAVVYDPSMNDLYTAYRNNGTYLNNRRVFIENNLEKPRVVLNLSSGWSDNTVLKEIFYKLSGFEIYRIIGSHAVNNSLVACGKYQGVICLAKDCFPYFASSLIIKEAGGIFTNINGEEKMQPSDRVFIGGNREIYEKLKLVVDQILL